MTTIQEHGEQTGEIVFIPTAKSSHHYPRRHLLKDDLHTTLCGLYDLDAVSDRTLAQEFEPERTPMCGRCKRISA